MTPRNGEPLVRIPTRDWTVLRDVYRKDWPRNIYSYNALENYIKWAHKDHELCERELRISSVDNGWSEHGIYILEDKTPYSYIIRLDACTGGQNELFQTALNCLDSLPYDEIIFGDNTCVTIKSYLKQANYLLINNCYPAKLYRLSREDCLKLEVRQRMDVIIKPLTMTDVTEVERAWLYRRKGSRYMISRNIKYNPSLGAYHAESGELCAWVLQNELGVIGFLYVKDAYRRRGLAEYLVKHISRKLAEEGFDATAHIVEENSASIKLFTSLGFKDIENNYWFIKEDFLNAVREN